MSSRSVTENHALVAVPVALIIQAMAKMIAATMASMPVLLPLPRRGNRAGRGRASRLSGAYERLSGEVAPHPEERSAVATGTEHENAGHTAQEAGHAAKAAGHRAADSSALRWLARAGFAAR